MRSRIVADVIEKKLTSEVGHRVMPSVLAYVLEHAASVYRLERQQVPPKLP